MIFFQQGDVILKECSKPKTSKTLKSDLLWKGQNHHHRLRGKFKLLKTDDKVFVNSSGCEIFHEEHKTIKIPKGFYELDIVREYDHLLEESRRVVD